MNSSGITPLDLKVLVKPDPVEEVTAGGIIKPQTAADKEKYAATRGTLAAVGPNAMKDWGADALIEVGARVVYAQYAGARVKGDDGDDYILMNDGDLIARAAQ